MPENEPNRLEMMRQHYALKRGFIGSFVLTFGMSVAAMFSALYYHNFELGQTLAMGSVAMAILTVIFEMSWMAGDIARSGPHVKQ